MPLGFLLRIDSHSHHGIMGFFTGTEQVDIDGVMDKKKDIIADASMHFGGLGLVGTREPEGIHLCVYQSWFH